MREGSGEECYFVIARLTTASERVLASMGR